MFYRQDWLLSQIQSMVALIAKLVFGKAAEEEPPELTAGMPASTTPLFAAIRRLLEAGRLCEAENLLFEHLRPGNVDALHCAYAFYGTLAGWSKEELLRCNFSMEEVHSGLEDALRAYGVDFAAVLAKEEQIVREAPSSPL